MITIMSFEDFETLALEARRRFSLAPGERLFSREDRVTDVFLLAGGAVNLLRTQSDGKELVIQRAQAGSVLAEGSLYSEAYHCDAVCVVGADLLAVSRKRIRDRLRDDSGLAERWSAYLARELQSSRHRTELLSKNKVSERLAGWLDWNGGRLPPKGRWKDLAAEIGVTPEALYRELAAYKRK